MEETMRTEVEVMTETSEPAEVTQEITIEDSSSGPSKGFMTLVVGGVALAAVAGITAFRKHKKKKANASKSEDEKTENDFCEEKPEDEEVESVEGEVEEASETPAEKK